MRRNKPTQLYTDWFQVLIGDDIYTQQQLYCVASSVF